MVKWEINIFGEEKQLEFLTNRLISSTINIKKENNVFVLRASVLNELDDVNIVKDRAAKISNSLMGLLRIKGFDPKEIKVTSITCKSKDDSWGIYLLPESITAISSFEVALDHTGPTIIEHDDFMENAILIENEYVQEALRYYGFYDENWDNLYKVYENIAKGLGGAHVLKDKDWVPSGEIGRFTQTAQSKDAIGDQARHGTPSVQAPKVPMTLNEAKFLIKTLLEKWLQTKI